jgi:SAM-dependent methyltransferase
MKALIKKVFPTLVTFRNRLLNYVLHYKFKGKPSEDVFSKIYNYNHWKDSESISGTGSNEKSTIEVIRIVNEVLRDFSVATMLDIPCGDFNWMKKVALSGINYFGGDIVPSLIEQNNKKFSTQLVSFKKLNLLESALPTVDLIFTRDCLVHFSYKDIERAIANVKKSGSKYWLATTFPDHKNYNIITGDWRPINLERSPFNLPIPLSIYNEDCAEDERYRDKSLALWRISDL